MSNHRSMLPQLSEDVFVTDGGIETTLIYQHGLELPDFAAFVLLETDRGREAIRRYFRSHVDVARRRGVGLVLDSATWRANPDWASKLGYDAPALARLTRAAVELLEEIRTARAGEPPTIVIGGAVGPRGDGYVVDRVMTPEEAERYHGQQIHTFADTAVDMVSAITMTYPDEAIGIARAAAAHRLPCAIAFTVETDGRLPNGQSIETAIAAVDRATGASPAYYMINCAHPTHFDHALPAEAQWLQRLRGLRVNASSLSHAELDACTELDDGDPAELGRQVAALRAHHPGFSVLGGCCGTDHRHIDEIAKACTPA